jgi:hypothetical protein
MKISIKTKEDKKTKKRVVARRMSRQLEAIISVAEKDIVAKRNISPVFSSAEDAVRYLNGR